MGSNSTADSATRDPRPVPVLAGALLIMALLCPADRQERVLVVQLAAGEGQALAPGRICARNLRDGSDQIVEVTADGRAQLELSPTDNYDLIVAVPGWAQVSPLSIAAGDEMLKLEIPIIKAGVVRGRILDHEHNPQIGLAVWGSDPTAPAPDLPAGNQTLVRTAEDGRFAVPALTAAECVNTWCSGSASWKSILLGCLDPSNATVEEFELPILDASPGSRPRPARAFLDLRIEECPQANTVTGVEVWASKNGHFFSITGDLGMARADGTSYSGFVKMPDVGIPFVIRVSNAMHGSVLIGPRMWPRRLEGDLQLGSFTLDCPGTIRVGLGGELSADAKLRAFALPLDRLLDPDRDRLGVVSAIVSSGLEFSGVIPGSYAIYVDAPTEGMAGLAKLVLEPQEAVATTCDVRRGVLPSGAVAYHLRDSAGRAIANRQVEVTMVPVRLAVGGDVERVVARSFASDRDRKVIQAREASDELGVIGLADIPGGLYTLFLEGEGVFASIEQPIAVMPQSRIEYEWWLAPSR